MIESGDTLQMQAHATVGESALRKARWRLVPLLAICYGVAYIDRINISLLRSR